MSFGEGGRAHCANCSWSPLSHQAVFPSLSCVLSDQRVGSRHVPTISAKRKIPVKNVQLTLHSNWSSTRHYWIVTDVVGSRYSKESSSNSPLLPHPPPFLTPLCLDSWSLQLPFHHSHSIVDLPSSCFDTLISFSVPLTPWHGARTLTMECCRYTFSKISFLSV